MLEDMNIWQSRLVNVRWSDVYEDYQKIYDWTMEFEKEKKIERGEMGRW